MNMLMQNTCHQPFFNLAEISANFKCQIHIRSILTNFTKLFPGLLKKGNACEKKNYFIFTEGVKMNFEGELVISPYAQYFLGK